VPLSVNLLQTRRWIHHSEGGGSAVRVKGMAAVYPVHGSVLSLSFIEPHTRNRRVDQTNQTSPLNQPLLCAEKFTSPRVSPWWRIQTNRARSLGVGTRHASALPIHLYRWRATTS
jgi:hypothetical protein